MSVAYITVEKNDSTGEVQIIVSGDLGDALDICNYIIEQDAERQAGYIGKQVIETS